MNIDQKFILRTFQLAKLGAGKVAPNPIVGCVIVHNGQIIGEGWHQKYGQAHAEVNAINSVLDQSKLSESTVYVNLEPCSHFGKTPPCASLLIEKQVKKVVICNSDPNPLVAGQGIEKLRAAGIEVVTNILEKEGREFNKYFFTFIEKKRPFIILKWAETANGFIAAEGGEQMQISNELSKKLVHKMRAESAAIMVGTNTAQLDNPSLTTRNWTGQNPIRVLIDKQLRFKQTMNIFSADAETLIYNLHGSAKLTQGSNGEIIQAEYVQLPENENFLLNLIDNLYHRNIQSVMVEGGTKLIESFLEQGLWDEALVIKSTNIIKNGIAAPQIKLNENMRYFLADDLLISYINSN